MPIVILHAFKEHLICKLELFQYLRRNEFRRVQSAAVQKPDQCNNSSNNSAQSNLGKGPRRDAVANLRRKISALVTVARPKFASKNTPSRGSIPKPHYLPHPWTRPTYDAKQHPDPIRRFSTVNWTDRRTHVRTYVQTDISSTGKFDDYRPLCSESDAA